MKATYLAGLHFLLLWNYLNVSLKEIKDDLISEAELIIYQMKAAQLSTDYETINIKADTLTNICKKLELIKQEEERLLKELDF